MATKTLLVAYLVIPYFFHTQKRSRRILGTD